MEYAKTRSVPSTIREKNVKVVEKGPGNDHLHFIYHWLDSKDPKGARWRIENIYWNGWRAFFVGFALFGAGITFLALGFACLRIVGDNPRGCVLLILGGMLSLPGLYSLTVLWYYVCGNRNYSYNQLLFE
ncbi:hypothetical protein TcG_01042 [Trypanosoma cruzi]|nr:hypothetical protein TcG_01042 [Trypanosoma cruzi]